MERDLQGTDKSNTRDRSGIIDLGSRPTSRNEDRPTSPQPKSPTGLKDRFSRGSISPKVRNRNISTLEDYQNALEEILLEQITKLKSKTVWSKSLPARLDDLKKRFAPSLRELGEALIESLKTNYFGIGSYSNPELKDSTATRISTLKSKLNVKPISSPADLTKAQLTYAISCSSKNINDIWLMLKGFVSPGESDRSNSIISFAGRELSELGNINTAKAETLIELIQNKNKNPYAITGNRENNFKIYDLLKASSGINSDGTLNYTDDVKNKLTAVEAENLRLVITYAEKGFSRDQISTRDLEAIKQLRLARPELAKQVSNNRSSIERG